MTETGNELTEQIDHSNTSRADLHLHTTLLRRSALPGSADATRAFSRALHCFNY